MDQLVVLSDCENRFLVNGLKKQFYEASIKIFGEGYNQIEQYIYQSKDIESAYILLLLTSQVMYEKYLSLDLTDRQSFAVNNYQRIKSIWTELEKRNAKGIIQFSVSELPEIVWGNYAAQEVSSFTFQIRKLNQLIAEECTRKDFVRILDLQQIHLTLGSNDFYDLRMYYLARFPFSAKAADIIIRNVKAVLQSFSGKQKKVVVCDLDGLLWGGAIGDDGIDGIILGEYGEGTVYKDIQRWLKCLKDRGILLAYCSKNTFENALLPFEKHPDMVLRLQDFVAGRASWNNKSDEILGISKELNLGLDSIVFLDDSPLERSEVRSRLPEVMVPELPKDPLEYLSYVKQLCLFESGPITAADLMRSDSYKAETSRNRARESYIDYDDFLRSIKLQLTVSAWEEGCYDRISQLQKRTNQFNLNSSRLSSNDVRNMAAISEDCAICISLSDDFGEYGLCGGASWEFRNKIMYINSIFISCRVFGRGVEECFLDWLVKTAQQNSCEKVAFRYENTGKNEYLSAFLKENGVIIEEMELPEISISKYRYHKTFISLRDVRNESKD